MPAASDHLRRGVACLRGNPALIAAALLQQALALGLTAVGFLPLAGVLDPFARAARDLYALGPVADPAAVAAVLAEFLVLWPDLAGSALLAAVPASCVWLVATLVFCWFQGGLYGLLDAADRRAGAVSDDPRAFRLAPDGGFARAFTAAANRLAAPCFKLIHAYLLAVLLAVLAWSLLLLAVANLTGPGGELTALGLGCAAFVLLVVPASLLAFVSFFLAQAELPRPGTTVAAAARRSFAVLRRHPGEVTVVFAAYLAASLLVAAALPVAGWTLAGFALAAVQLSAGVVVTTAFAAATVSLMHRWAPEGAA